jgi:hypothetical protein
MGAMATHLFLTIAHADWITVATALRCLAQQLASFLESRWILKPGTLKLGMTIA